MKAFADEVDFKLELDPDVVKENLAKGVKDIEKNDGSWKIRPISINEDVKYTPISPYDNRKTDHQCVLIRASLPLTQLAPYESQCTAATSPPSATACT
jgi:hypothetical protein